MNFPLSVHEWWFRTSCSLSLDNAAATTMAIDVTVATYMYTFFWMARSCQTDTYRYCVHDIINVYSDQLYYIVSSDFVFCYSFYSFCMSKY